MKDFTGLQVVSTNPPSMSVSILPGQLKTSTGSIELRDVQQVAIKPAGKRSFVNQVYHIRGVQHTSPSGWNGEDIRGSGGAPYQRMVPGTLNVYNKSRDVLYIPEQDYTLDYYWGTIKRHPKGHIAEGQELSLDYDVWLCRYDAIVLSEDGRIHVVEGDTEAPESRELLLPEPPMVKDGFVLAHVFTGWGQEQITDGGSRLVGAGEPGGPHGKRLVQPALTGRYEDMEPRAYLVEIQDVPTHREIKLRIAATGEDYGTGDVLTMETLRWTEPMVYRTDQTIPLIYKTAYGQHVDWGLGLNFSQLDMSDLKVRSQFSVRAIPEMIFDLRKCSQDPLDVIPLEQTEQLYKFKGKMAGGESARIAFYGESTTRSGLWPYLVMEELRRLYPETKLYSSNVAVGGEGTTKGQHRLVHEVLPLKPDLIVLEYLINDTASGNKDAVEQNVRTILETIRSAGACCLIVTNNGMNPVFAQQGSTRSFFEFHGLYRKLAQEYNCAFVGAFEYFARLHQFGKYYITELKGNMVNHPYGNVDNHWGPFDQVIHRAIIRVLS